MSRSPAVVAAALARLGRGTPEECLKQAVGDGPRFTLWGYGEEMPLAEVREPFVGDHWWYPERTFWRLTTVFDGEEEVLAGGSNRGAAKRFRAADTGDRGRASTRGAPWAGRSSWR